MQDLNVTLVQARQFWEDKAANLAHFESLLPEAGTTDLIVLPEMFHTGFSMNAAQLAERMDDSIAMEWLKKQSFEKNAAFYASFIAEESGRYYNRGVFMLPSGEYRIYDKRQLFSLAGEDRIFSPGDSALVAEYKGWRIRFQICYDLRFPEISRNLLDSNQSPVYDVLIYVANWPERRAAHWKALLTARSIENQCYTIGVNRVGTDGTGLEYSGDSVAVDALGDTLAVCEAGKETVKNVLLNKEALANIRKQLSFLKDVKSLNY